MSFFFDFEPHTKDALPIAIVHGGELNHKILYLNDSKSVMDKTKKRENIDTRPYEHLLKGYTTREKTIMLMKAQEAYVKGIDEELFLGTEIEKKILHEMNNSENKNTMVRLPPESSFRLIHTNSKKIETRQIYYIAGPSGSGKSWIARGLAESYIKAYPDRKVYLISHLAKDETLDNMKGGKCIRLNLDRLVQSPPKLEEMKNSLFIFDDYDALENKQHTKVVFDLITTIATEGRHESISMCCLSHYLTNYSKTRLILSEASHFVLYPQSTGSKPLSYLLGTHIGLDNKEIQSLKKMGRWVCVHKNYPPFVVSEHTAKLLHAE
jgi:hypothetical protein